MEQYLHRGAFSGMMNALGLRLVIALAGLGWFIGLWGLSMPSILAGLALGLLGQLAMSRVRARYAAQREDMLRARLGGEMVLEEWLLCPAHRAHFQAAALLGQKYPLVLSRVTEDGVLCFYGKEVLLVACLTRPADAQVSSGDVAALQRACRFQKADRGVLCLTCRSSPKVESQAATGPVRVRIISRETMLHLAGQAAPATDEQLMALKARRKRLAAVDSVTKRILHPSKARRYMGYGIGLMLIYVVTGLRYYPIPAAVCMGLGAACRCRKREAEEL